MDFDSETEAILELHLKSLEGCKINVKNDMNDLRTMITKENKYKFEVIGFAQLFMENIEVTLETSKTNFQMFHLLINVYHSLKFVNSKLDNEIQEFVFLEFDIQQLLTAIHKVSKISLQLML